MAPQRTLRFKIRQDGLVEETVEGMVGNSCVQLTEKLEAALGSLESKDLTADAYVCSQEQSELIPEQISTF